MLGEPKERRKTIRVTTAGDPFESPNAGHESRITVQPERSAAERQVPQEPPRPSCYSEEGRFVRGPNLSAPWCNWLTRRPLKAESSGSIPDGATNPSNQNHSSVVVAGAVVVTIGIPIFVVLDCVVVPFAAF